MNLFEQIRQRCRDKGSEPALSFGGVGPDTVSYQKLGEFVDIACARLLQLGVAPGAIYGLWQKSALMHVVLMLALERLGAAFVFLKDAAHTDALKLTAILADREAGFCPCPVLPVHVGLLTDAYQSAPSVNYTERPPDKTCIIVFTSGSTGRPKPIACTYEKLAANLVQQDLAYGETFKRSKRRLCCIGFNVLFGYITLIRTLAEGGMVGFWDADVPRTIRRIALYKFNCLIGSPLQLAEFAACPEDPPGAFQSLEMIICAGSRLPSSLADRLRERMCRYVLNGYGSSEAGIVATAPAEQLDLDAGEVGHVVPKVQVEIVDEITGLPVIGGSGRVRIRGKGVVRSYFGEHARQDAYFDGEWFYPGDFGQVSSQGLLSISARQDGLINVGGVKTSFESIEAKLHGAPGVKDFAVVSIADDLGVNRIVTLVVPAAGWSEAAFHGYCRGKLERAFWPVKVVTRTEIPRGPSGKIDRQLLPTLT